MGGGINRAIFSCDIPPQGFISKTTGLRHQGLGVGYTPMQKLVKIT